VFSPAFGAFLHARNAQSLGRTDEAKANRIWFYASLAYFGFVLMSTFIPAIPNVVFSGAALGILLGWYISLGKKQIEHVKSRWQGRYTRKPWGKPLLIAFACLAGFMVVATLLSIVAASLFGIQ
jgi:hypothetical protein